MKCTKLLLVLITTSILLVSCTDDDGTNTPVGAYDHGVLIVNEGDGTAGSITFISNDRTTIQQDVFGAENQGDGLGGYVQSVFFDEEKAFIISNGSNKITIVNRYTFELVAKIETGLSVPRYGVVKNGKAYVTNLATFNSLTDDFVTVIDLSTFAVTSSIMMNAIADKITEANGKLYVANGAYGDGASLTVINPTTNTIETTIATGISPNSFEEENGILYVLCSDYVNPSKLLKIKLSTNEILSEITFPEALGNAQNLNIEDGKLYFTVNSAVYSEALSATSINATPLFTAAATTLYGFAVEDDAIFVADAKDFTSDGKVFIYSTSGILENQFTVGLIPNGFYFND